ncbi:MAG: hypothetical protein KDK08_12870 [Rhizobiaceae bacterium]|nr:hypothetical protein [Rhizobiaceae bacterium]
MHLLFSAAAAYTMASYEQRIFDVRQFPDHCDHSTLVGAYLESREATGKTVVAGSSFAFGYPFASELSFPAYMTEKPINASVIGIGLSGITSNTINEIKERGLRPSRLIVEIPLINEVGALIRPRTSGKTCSDLGKRSLLRYALASPVSLQWYSLLTDPYRGAVASGPISIAPVPDDYFATTDQFEQAKRDLRTNIEAAFASASAVADNAFLFVTPVYVPGVDQAGRDGESIRRQFDFAQSACVEVAGDRCIMTDHMLDNPAYFTNITHIGPDGAAYLADIIEASVDRAAALRD